MVWRMEDGSLIISGVGALAYGTGNYEGYIKDVTRAGGERDAELIRTMGNYQQWDPKNTTAFEFNATAIGSTATFEMMLLGGSQSASMGSAVEKWPRNMYDFHMIFSDTTNVSGAQMKVSCLSSYVTTVGFKATTADAMEETLTWKCLPQNYKRQYTINRIASPIV
jgi:hypothetical protein